MNTTFSFSEADVINSLKEVGVTVIHQTDKRITRMVTQEGEVHILKAGFSLFGEEASQLD